MNSDKVLFRAYVFKKYDNYDIMAREVVDKGWITFGVQGYPDFLENHIDFSMLGMWSTLYDYDGNQVFSGDILESTRDSRLLRWEVLFKDGQFGIRNIHPDLTPAWDQFYPVENEYYFKDRKVVGNIYDNSELYKHS